MKLKYTDKNKTTFNYIKTKHGKININLTVKPEDIIDVEKEVAEPLLRTKSFVEIKETKKEIKTKKREGDIVDDYSEGIR